MLTPAHGRKEDMSTFVDKYLTEDDKGIILHRPGTSKVLSIGDGDQFLLHSTAVKVKKFIEDGHFIRFIAYGLDYFMLQDSGTFTSSVNDFEDIDDLMDFSSAYFFEWYQEGSLDDETLDRAYIWQLTTPYVAMMMTDDARQEMHKAVDCLWMSPAIDDKSLYIQCYDIGRRLVEGSMEHWMENAPIAYSGCGYNNIIKPQEVDA